jgi:WD40 repeat protein
VTAVAFSPDGRLLASGGDKTVRIWEMPGGVLRHSLVEHKNSVYAVAFSPDGRLMAVRTGGSRVGL